MDALKLKLYTNKYIFHANPSPITMYAIHIPKKNINVFKKHWHSVNAVLSDYKVLQRLFELHNVEDIVLFNQKYRLVPRFDRKGNIRINLNGLYFATFLNDGNTYILHDNRAYKVDKADQLFAHIAKDALPFIYE